MQNENPSSSFPETQRDIANLKKTAGDATSDLTDAAEEHGGKARKQLQELAGHVRKEAGYQLGKVRPQIGELVESTTRFVTERPFTCLAIALAAGFILGRRKS